LFAVSVPACTVRIEQDVSCGASSSRAGINLLRKDETRRGPIDFNVCDRSLKQPHAINPLGSNKRSWQNGGAEIARHENARHKIAGREIVTYFCRIVMI